MLLSSLRANRQQQLLPRSITQIKFKVLRSVFGSKFHRNYTKTSKLFTEYNNSVISNNNSNNNDIRGSNNNNNSKRLLVIGSGVAGCSTALVAAEKYSIPVSLIFAGTLPTDCNSYWAQGGIIYRNYHPDVNDTPSSLVKDIMRAGAGLSDTNAAWKVATDGPERIRELLLSNSYNNGGSSSSSNNGPFANVPFDRDDKGNLSYCLEASHSAPRIIHYADHTGQAITQHITEATRRHPLIDLVPDTLVTDLIVSDGMCLGVETYNTQTGKVSNVLGSHGTVLANGGLANIYEHSTNPSGFNAIGSSVALAMRTSERHGHVVATKDLEYVQFHPTSLYMPNESRFLLTEALRGEGAILRDASGRAFARDFHSDGELAPRDIVARGVYNQSKQTSSANDGRHNVYLDISHRDGQWLNNRFPTIQNHLKAKGLDLTRDMIPIIPAAHYTCGGIDTTTNLNGCTTLPNLYVAGEAACTGLHGGNRLASTSLLEALVFGASVADYCGIGEGRYIQDSAQTVIETKNSMNNNNSYCSSQLVNGEAEIVRLGATEMLQELRKTMWDYVGVERRTSGLKVAIEKLYDIQEESIDLYEKHKSLETIALLHGVYAGLGVASAAYSNRKSIGAHYIVDDETDDTIYSDNKIAGAAHPIDDENDLIDDFEDDDEDDDEVVALAAVGAQL